MKAKTQNYTYSAFYVCKRRNEINYLFRLKLNNSYFIFKGILKIRYFIILQAYKFKCKYKEIRM